MLVLQQRLPAQRRLAPRVRRAGQRTALVLVGLYLLLLALTLVALLRGAAEPWATIAALLPMVPVIAAPPAVSRWLDRLDTRECGLQTLLTSFMVGAVLSAAFLLFALSGARMLGWLMLPLYVGSWTLGVWLAARQHGTVVP